MNVGAALLILAALAHLAPEHVAAWRDESAAAWEVVGYGLEVSGLWAAVAIASTVAAVRAVAVWAFVESAMRPVCRLAFPMDRPPPRGAAGENLCELATGLPLGWLSLVAAMFAVAIAAGSSTKTTTTTRDE